MNDALLLALKKKLMNMPADGGMGLPDERLDADDENRGLMDQAPELGEGVIVEGAEASDDIPSPEALEILMSIADRSSGGRTPGSLGERAAASAKAKMDEMKKKK